MSVQAGPPAGGILPARLRPRRLVSRAPLFFTLPAALFLAVVFAAPLVFLVSESLGLPDATLAYYDEVVSDSLYAKVLMNTVEISLLSAAITLLLGYPIAYHLVKLPPRRRNLMLILVLLPFWTSILVKSFAFAVILGQAGILNSLVIALTGADIPFRMMYNRFGVVVGMAHYLLPFMVFSILASLQAQDPALRRAAEIMGAGRLRIFLRVTLPLSMPGVMAGTLLCLILSMGMFITPALLGGRGDMMISSLVEFHVRTTLDWNVASALSVALMLATALLVVVLARVRGGRLIEEASR